MNGNTSQSDVAMKGGGYYSLATKGAKDVIDAATPLVLDAIDRMRLATQERPFVFSDMGCADGGTSLDMVRTAARKVRAAAPGREVCIVYTDQPRNDYNALFQIVHGLTGGESVTGSDESVHVLASATSFYRRILPAGTLDLGFSATAMHWLSRKPCNITDHVQAVGASGAELAAFAEQGRSDWETILLARAAELASGGRLVLVNFCRDEDGRYLGNTGGVNMFDTFNALWLRLLDEGVITREEYVNMTLPQYYKDPDEFAAPLEDAGGPVHRAGLRLEHAETRVVPCPFAADFDRHGDAARFAREYVPTLRSWTEATFHGALSPQRPADERRRIIDHYYDSYERLVREQPAGHGMAYVHCYMAVRKM
ncbi:MAG: hypothetical protein WB783_03705 [Arenicellales bacterium]